MAAETSLLARLFKTPPQQDGTATALEAHATGIGPVLPDLRSDLGKGDRGGIMSRRQRPIALPGEVLVESVGQKVLHAWLQNRHQTLYPLTVNLRTLEAAKAGLLARMMAFVLLAGTRPPDSEQIGRALAWLGQVGGGEDVKQALRAALAAPEALTPLLHEVHGAGLAAYAYVVALVATNPRDAAGQLFVNYLAARLALPPNVVRSADRRYRHQSSASVRAVSAS